MALDIVAALSERLSRPLPGLSIQRRMAPVGRIPPDYHPDPPAARASAVLIIVTAGQDIVFIRRAQDGRRHSGQIAFPGGMREVQDPDLSATALRETEEEIGVPRGSVRLVGALTPLYISVTNFSVQPYIGFVHDLPSFVCQPGEVDEVILLPVSGFASARTVMELNRGGRVSYAPTYRFNNVDVWGATAMITAEFLAVWDESFPG